MSKITSTQLRAARAMLNLKQHEVARKSNVISEPTLRRIETARTLIEEMHRRTREGLIDWYRKQGLVFTHQIVQGHHLYGVALLGQEATQDELHDAMTRDAECIAKQGFAREDRDHGPSTQ